MAKKNRPFPLRLWPFHPLASAFSPFSSSVIRLESKNKENPAMIYYEFRDKAESSHLDRTAIYAVYSREGSRPRKLGHISRLNIADGD